MFFFYFHQPFAHLGKINGGFYFVLSLSLKTGVTDEVLHEEASRARKLCGSRLDVEGFSQYLKHPVTEAVQDIFSLFEEVKHLSMSFINSLLNRKQINLCVSMMSV